VSLQWKPFFVIHLSVVAVCAAFAIWHRVEPGGPIDADLYRVAWAVGMAGVLSACMLAAYRGFVARPLGRILEGAERLAHGDDEHRIDIEGGGELAQLAGSINRMADGVARARSELEWQVHERTEDLRAVLEEVHERSRIAEEVNRRLEEADRRKTEFLTNVSHELRTPLNSILGFVSLLQDNMYESEEERQEFLENTRQSASHLLHLVTDVLSAAQIEAGTLTVSRMALHPGDAIHDVLRLTNVLYREKGLAVSFEVEGNLMVLADEFKLRQVLLNLLGNAIKFTDTGSIVVRARSQDDHVRFEVEDTGEGIPTKDLERIFEKFHQVDSRTARHAGGTGLGLSICRELVQLMGGTIGAESDGPGKGALFHFKLPAVPSEANAKA
jgi:two-component system sensor histidine kinase BarA